MQVRDIMTKDIVIADTNDTIIDVAKLMSHHNIGCVPVTENGERVLGVITDRDIVIEMAKHSYDPYNTLATSIMSDNVYFVRPDVDVKFAFDLMKKQQVRRLPVMENGKILGMISLGDLAVSAYKEKEEISEALTEISMPNGPKNI